MLPKSWPVIISEAIETADSSIAIRTRRNAPVFKIAPITAGAKTIQT